MTRLHVIDSHTEGEPTRLVLAGGPDLGRGPLAERLARLCRDHDDLRTAVVCEPRGSAVLVGALLCEPVDPAAAAGVIFFNEVGYLGMCGHGTIGLAASLAWLGRLAVDRHRIETPVGEVVAELHKDGRVSVHNVPAHRAEACERTRVADEPQRAGELDGASVGREQPRVHVRDSARATRRGTRATGPAGASRSKLRSTRTAMPTPVPQRRPSRLSAANGGGTLPEATTMAMKASGA